MVVDGDQIASAEGENHFQDVAVAGTEAESCAVGELAAFAEMELADFIGREALAPVEDHIDEGAEPGEKKDPAHDGRGAGVEARREIRDMLEEAADEDDLLQVL